MGVIIQAASPVARGESRKRVAAGKGREGGKERGGREGGLVEVRVAERARHPSPRNVRV